MDTPVFPSGLAWTGARTAAPPARHTHTRGYLKRKKRIWAEWPVVSVTFLVFCVFHSCPSVSSTVPNVHTFMLLKSDWFHDRPARSPVSSFRSHLPVSCIGPLVNAYALLPGLLDYGTVQLTVAHLCLLLRDSFSLTEAGEQVQTVSSSGMLCSCSPVKSCRINQSVGVGV